MTRKRRRLYLVIALLLSLGTAAALMLTAFEENIVFFHSPTDVVEKKPPEGRRFRLGGLVEEGSMVKDKDGLTFRFTVTDTANVVPVSFRGILPDLFREGQGVVTEGSIGPGGVFIATEVLAKHDENYMPKEVADSLKAQGHWQGKEQE
jgi:cytochrome c-type biogenesis protein CcmE